MYFSASTMGFYSGGKMPADVIHESKWETSYENLLNGQSKGQRIEANDSGHPILVGDPIFE